MDLGGAKDYHILKQVLENGIAQISGQPLVHKRYALQSFTNVMAQKLFG